MFAVGLAFYSAKTATVAANYARAVERRSNILSLKITLHNVISETIEINSRVAKYFASKNNNGLYTKTFTSFIYKLGPLVRLNKEITDIQIEAREYLEGDTILEDRPIDEIIDLMAKFETKLKHIARKKI